MSSPYIQFPDNYGATTGNLTPYQQNLASQNQNIQQLLQQGNGLASQAGASTGGGFDPVKLAQALKGGDRSLTQDLQTLNAYAPWTQMNVANAYGTDPYSEQSRMLAMQERGM